MLEELQADQVLEALLETISDSEEWRITATWFMLVCDQN
jgi:hypothetical protein